MIIGDGGRGKGRRRRRRRRRRDKRRLGILFVLLLGRGVFSIIHRSPLLPTRINCIIVVVVIITTIVTVVLVIKA